MATNMASVCAMGLSNLRPCASVVSYKTLDKTDDVINTGGGSFLGDEVYAGKGDDRVVDDGSIFLADGGDGTDTLAVASNGQNLILDVFDTYSNFEEIDLRGLGNNTLTVFTNMVNDFTSASGIAGTITVHGDVGDTVDVSIDFTLQGNNGTFSTYANLGGETLIISNDINVI